MNMQIFSETFRYNRSDVFLIKSYAGTKQPLPIKKEKHSLGNRLQANLSTFRQNILQ